MRALRGARPVDFFSADADPHAAGLYIVDPGRRLIAPRGDDPAFADLMLAACVERRIDVLVPTVDTELLPLAAARERFEAQGVALLLAPRPGMETCLDKWSLMQALDGVVPLPRSSSLEPGFCAEDWELPVIVKPRSGSGSRGISLVETAAELAGLAADGGEEMLVQQHLPGAEYSIDVLAGIDGAVRAAVPRLRLKIDSGIAITSRTLHDERLEEMGRRAFEALGLTGVANVQAREDAAGEPRLMEINPRFPGTMPLTVSAGINMPALALAEVLGEPLPPGSLGFRDVALTRLLEDVPVELGELEALEREAATGGVAGALA